MRKARFFSKARNEHFEVERIIGEFHGDQDGPVLVFFGGIHGNESSGVVALIEVMEQIKMLKPEMRGSIYAIAGNMSALEKGQRYITMDLNRIWTKEQIRRIESGQLQGKGISADEEEQLELFNIGKGIFEKHAHQVYCIDLHTTSGPTVPFITLNDTLVNRKFATKFPVPVIIGIEEFLAGPILSWVMEIGYPALAFEAGEHHSLDSINYHKAFVWLSLIHGGLIHKEAIPEFGKYQMTLAASNADHGKVFEVYYRKGIHPKENFRMKPGYANLQPVVQGEPLAENIDGIVASPDNGRVFMPLYQSQGSDGFFLVREVASFWLKLSALLRTISFDTVLTWLPGVQRDPKEKYTLIVNKRVARFLAIEIFHLLGYRSKKRLKDVIRFSKREYDVRGVVGKQ